MMARGRLATPLSRFVRRVLMLHMGTVVLKVWGALLGRCVSVTWAKKKKHVSLHVVPYLRTIVKHQESVTVTSSDSADAVQSLVLFSHSVVVYLNEVKYINKQCLFQ